MKNPFTTKNYKWNVDGLIQCIKDNNLKSKIIFSTPTSAIVHVVSYSESEILGAQSTWCISQHKVSWEQYVEKTNGIQLFFYCFNHSPLTDDSLYGATFQVKGNIITTYCCFTRENNPIGKTKGFNTDEEALAIVVEKEFGKGVFEELANLIYEIYNNNKTENKLTVRKISSLEDYPAYDWGSYDYDDFFIINN